MTTCPGPDDLIALSDGELTESRARAVRAHTSDCTRCSSELTELATVASDLRAPVPGALGRRTTEQFADELLARLDDARTVPQGRRIPRWALALAAAAALPLAITAATRSMPSSTGGGEWTARGGASTAEVSMRASLRFGRVSGTTFEPFEDGALLAADALLTAEIGGTEGSPRYLLAFLVDSKGERHWIAPSYPPGAPPSSVAIPSTSTPRVLDAMVRLDRPAPGSGRLVAIVLGRSESVEYVEHASLDELTPARLMAHYPGALVVATRVEVR